MKGLNNMASMRKRKNSYQITVSNGRDSSGKQIVETATFILDSTKTEKQNLKELEKFAYDFEQKVRSGKYLSGEKLTFQEFTEIWFEDYGNINLPHNTRCRIGRGPCNFHHIAYHSAWQDYAAHQPDYHKQGGVADCK